MSVPLKSGERWIMQGGTFSFLAIPDNNSAIPDVKLTFCKILYGLGIYPVFFPENAGSEGIFIVIIINGHNALDNDGPRIDTRINKMNGAAGKFHSEC